MRSGNSRNRVILGGAFLALIFIAIVLLFNQDISLSVTADEPTETPIEAGSAPSENTSEQVDAPPTDVTPPIEIPASATSVPPSNTEIPPTATLVPDHTTPEEPVQGHDDGKPASLAVNGVCEGNYVVFFIQNTGNPGDGDMSQPTQYRVYAGDSQVSSGDVFLGGGQSMDITWTSAGQNIRLEANQPSGHPGGLASTALTCGEAQPLTNTPIPPPADTPVPPPPADTPIPPPPTNTSVPPPANTLVPPTPTHTEVLPTNTPVPPKVSKTPTQALTTPQMLDSATEKPEFSVFDPALSKIGVLPMGSIGLPGERLTWITTVTNDGNVTGTDIVLLDNVRPEMRIDNVSVQRGTFTVNGQLVTVTIPYLDPNESIEVRIETTVLYSPVNGRLVNTVTTEDNSDSATATVNVPSAPMIAALSVLPPVGGPNPNLSGLPDTDVFAGSTVCFTASFTNAGNPGFGPYLRIILPPELILQSTSFINTAQSYITVGTFPVGPPSELTDPISDDVITGTPGHNMYVVRYPIGSVVQGNPALDMEICVQVDPNTALIGVDYPFEVIPGYEFGNTPTGTNGPIVDVNDPGKDGEITPILVIFEKTDNTPESERPPGPIWEYQYTLSMTLAPGQTLVNAAMNDTLDAKWQFTRLESVTGTCNFTQGATTLPAAPPPETGGGTITIPFTLIDNPSNAATCNINAVYSGYILDILTEDGVGGGPSQSSIDNTATFDSTWTGNDGASSIPVPQETSTDSVLVENMVFQKGVTPVDVIPTSGLQYSIAFQITEYNGIVSAVMTDTIPNGISVDYDSYSVTVGGTPYPIPNAAITRDCNTDGTITVTFDIMDATGIPDPLASGGSGTIRYNGLVDSFYRQLNTSCNANLGEPVRAADSMTNTVIGDFELVDGATQTNNSSATVNVRPVTIEKQTLNVAINPPENGVGYVHGEEVTFRLTMEIPSGDTQGVVFRDFFPLPVFDIDDADLGFELPVGPGPFTLPIQNTSNLCYQQFNAGDNNFNCGITWGPDTTLTPGIQSISINGTENSLTIVFDDVNTSGPQTVQVDITITVIDNPFADGLYLSNQFEAEVQNSDNQTLTADAISYLRLSAPFLEILKGVVAVSDTDAVINPAPPGGVGVNSDSNATDLDAGDLVTYTITVGNVGGTSAFDVLITDDVPPGLENCTLLNVTNGNGAVLAYTGDLFAGGITLDDPISGNPGSTVAGPTNQAVVRMRCEVIDGVSPLQIVTNTAEVVWSTLPADMDQNYPGYNFTTPPITYPPRSDDATIQVRDVSLAKVALPINPSIGELVTYTITVDVPEGTLNNVQIVDVLPVNMAFAACTSVTSNGTLNTSLSGSTDFSAACNPGTNPTVTNGARTSTWTLGNLSPAGSTSNGQDDQIIITYTAVVLDVGGNVRGTTLTNTATFSADTLLDKTAQSTVTVIEPQLQVAKSANPTTGDAGDTITFTIAISHVNPPSNATAYDIVLNDVVPADFTNIILTGTSGVAPSTGPTLVGSTVSATWDSLTTAQTATLTFTAQLANTVEPSQVLTNTANITYDSLPEDNATDQSPFTTPTDRERDYNTSDPATVTVPTPTVAKVVASTSHAATIPDATGGSGGIDGNEPDLTIGEEVTYRITATFRDGVTEAVTITDAFPTTGVVFEYVSSRLVSIGTETTNGVSTDGNVTLASAAINDAGTTGANNVSWTLGDVTVTPGTANRTVVFEVVLRVDDNAANNGTANNDKNRTNTATLAYTNANNVASNTTATAQVDLVEPELQLDKDNNPTGVPTVDAGDTVQFRLTISHTANSNANAYDVVVTDTLPPESNYINVISSTCGAVTDNSTPPTVTFSFAQLLTSTGSCSIVYSVQVGGSVQPNQNYINTAQASYSTLPGTPTDDRTKTTNTDTAQYQTRIPEADKTIVSTNLADTTGNNVAIGEVIRYQFVITVPEGVTNGVTVRDRLAPGLAFMQIDAGPDIATLTIPGSVTASAGNEAAILATATIGNTCSDLSAQNGCELNLNFGNLTNTDTNNGTQEQIIIRYSVVVLDVAANLRDQTRTNTVTISYASGVDVTGNAPDVTIVEPQLQVVKTANPTTGDAGDTITFTIAISHVNPPSNAAAYDVVLNDVVPADLTNVIITGTSGVAPSTGPTLVGNTISASWDRLTTAQTATITFTAQLVNTVEPGQIITNDADITYDSLPGDNVTDQSPYNTTSDERDYTAADDATVTVPGPTITKAVFGTSDAGNQNYAIGEEITYHITVTLPEGVIEDVVISDTPPSGTAILTPVSMTVLDAGSGTDTAMTGVVVGTSDTTAPLSINFGDVTNPPGGSNQIVLEVVARVTDIAANSGVLPTQDTNVTNTATLAYTDASNNPQTLTDTAQVNFIEPELTVVKDNNPVGIPTVEAGDTIQFRVTVSHTANSLATAYDITLTDTLPTAGMTFGSIIGGSTTCTGAAASFASPVVTFTVTSLTPAAGSCVIVYSVTIGNDVEPSSTYTNTVTGNYSTQPGTPLDDRTKTLNSDPAQFRTPSPTITKTVNSTSLADTGTGGDGDENLTIGEEVTYHLTVAFPEGTIDNVRVSDILPSVGVSFEYISSQIVSIGNGMTLGSGGVGTAGTLGGSTVTWSLGQVTNPPGGGDTIVFAITARVDDLPANVGLVTGQDLDVVNTGRLVYEDNNNIDQTRTDTETVDIVEPERTLAKAQVTAGTTFDAGDNIQYTLTLGHTAQSTANAYDLVVTDTLPTTGTTLNGVPSGTCVIASTDTSTPGQIVFTINQLNQPGTCTITYTVTLGNDIEPRTTYSNTAGMSYSSLPGTPPDDRTRTTTPVNTSFNTPGPSITKAVFGTSDAGNQNYTIGEEITYHITVTLTEGTTQDVVISDTPPSGTAILTPVSMTVLGAVDGTDTAMTGVVVGTNDTTAPLSINFGDVVNPPGGSNQIVLEVVARVTDNAVNSGLVPTQDTNVTNTATLAYTDGDGNPQTLTDTAQVNFIEPELTVAKDNEPTGVPVVDGGDTIQFRITVSHTANSLATAYDITLTDTLPTAGTSFGSIIGGSTTCTGAGASFASPVITFTVPSLTLAAGSCNIVYSVVVGNDVVASSTYTNTVTGTYSTQTGTPPDDRTKNIGSDTAEFDTRGPLINKNILSTSLADTGNGLDLDPDLTIGETVTYELVATVSEGVLTTTQIIDTLPATFSIVSSQVTAIGANISGSALAVGAAGTVAGNTVTFNFGDITNTADGVVSEADRIRVQIVARLADDVSNANGQTKTNTGEITFTDSLGNPVALSDTADVDVVEPNLALTKAFSLTEAIRGTTLSITLTLTNNGTAPAYDITLTDIFNATNPSGDADLSKIRLNSVAVTSQPAGANTDVSSSVTGAFGTSAINATMDRLLVGETVVLTANITIDPSATPVPLLGANTLNNIATADYDSLPGDDPVDRNYSTTGTDTLDIITPTLVLTKVDNVDPVNAGGVVIYTITVRNTGTPNIPANNVIVRDTLPTPTSGVVVQLVTPSQGSCAPVAGGVLTCSLGIIASGAQATIQVRLLVNPSNTPQVMTNNVNVTTDEGNDQNTSEDTTIQRTIDLALTKVVSQSQPREGDLITYTLQATNNGPSNATNVIVQDNLPNGLTYVRFVPTLLPCVFAAPTLTCTFPTLAAGSTITIGVEATVNANAALLAQPIVNGASVIANESGGAGYPNETNTTNNTATTPITVQTVDLAVQKTVNPAAPAEGALITYTITVTNNGPANATGVEITDDLNGVAGITYQSDNSGGAYNSGTGVWTVGSVNAGSSRSLTITARVDAGASALAQPIVNNAVLTAVDQTDGNPANNQDDASITVGGLDLRVVKTVSDPTPQEGDSINYFITVTNLGAANATNVAVTDDLNGVVGITYLSDNGGGTYNPATGVWTVGNINAGVSRTLRVTVRVANGAAAQPQPIINNAALTAVDQTDGDPTNNQSSANITVEPLDLRVVKTVNNNTPQPGDNIIYTVVVTNLGPANATNVIINDDLDPNLTFISAAPGGVYNPANGEWAVGSLNAGVSRTLTITAQVNGIVANGTVIPNTASLLSVDQTDSDPTNNSDDAPVTVGGLDLRVVKTVNDPTPREGDTITYTITVTNLGAADATGVVIEDVFPAGLSGFVFTPSLGSYNIGTSLWTVGNLPNGSSATLTVTAQVNAGTSGTVINNTASLDSVDQIDADPTNNQDDASITIEQVDLAVTKVVNNAGPSQGDTIIYTITVTNLGDGNATGVTLTEDLPADGVSFTLLGNTVTQGTYTSTPPTSIWNVGNLARGASATLRLTVRVEVNSGIIFNNVTVTGDQPDPDTTNNTDTAGIAIDGTDLAVQKTVNNTVPFQGDQIIYTVVARNLGPANATGVIVADILPAGVAYVSDDSGGTFDPITGDWTIGNLASGASITLNITVTVTDSSGQIINTATVSGNEPDPDPTNNTDDASIIVGGADLRLSKVRTVSGTSPGDLVIYEVTVTNDGPNPVSNVQVTDYMPATITYVSATPGKGTASTPPAKPIVWTVGTLAIGESSTISITGRINNNYGTTTNIAEVTGASLPDPDSTPGNRTDGEDDQASTIGPVVGTLPSSPSTSQGQSGAAAPNTPTSQPGDNPPVSSIPPVAELPVCTVGCIPFQVYHTNRDGNWEIYRLGQAPGTPNANPNLSQGFGEGVDDIAPSLSPNGAWIAFSSNRDGNWEIYLGRTDGTEQRRVTHNTIAIDTDPVWGPNNYIVYESSRDGNWNLYLLDTISGQERRLTESLASDLNASWAPTGDKLLFQSDRSGKWQIYELNLSTGLIRLISDDQGQDIDPQYSPDGQFMVFRSYRGDNAEKSVLYLAGANGRNPQPISNSDGNASNAAWSADVNIIAYQSDLFGDLDIFIYEVNSRRTRQLTDNDIDDYAPSWICGTTDLIFTSDIDGNPNIFQTEALPITAPPVNLLDATQAIRRTDSTFDDIYPEGSPTEENASREGRLPEMRGLTLNGLTQFLPIDMSITIVDSSIELNDAWDPIAACIPEDS